MVFEVVTGFPEFFKSALETSLLGRAISGGILTVGLHDLRDFCSDPHRTIDDYPYGGGPGMVLKPEPFFRAVEKLLDKSSGEAPVILLTPAGRPLTAKVARELAHYQRIILLCGHYEGVDERVAEFLATDQISIGDYVLSGGEPAALVVIDAVARFIPGFLGNLASLEEETHAGEGMVEYPQYTRPAEFRGLKVPEVLLSGHHQKVREWRLDKIKQRAEKRQHLIERGK